MVSIVAVFSSYRRQPYGNLVCCLESSCDGDVTVLNINHQRQNLVTACRLQSEYTMVDTVVGHQRGPSLQRCTCIVQYDEVEQRIRAL